MKNVFSKLMFQGVISLIIATAAFVFTSGAPVEALSEAAAGRKTVITAAGATLPLPFYNEAFKLYWEKNDIPVTYAGIGTERGFKSLKNQQIDFAGIDVPPTKAELDSLPAKSILIPTCMGAVTIAYHLEGVDNLRLTGELIADIYLGKILKWNDARIAEINPGKQLPDKEIYPVFRLDGSGTTYIFSDYLTKVSTDWKAKIGTGKAWRSGYRKCRCCGADRESARSNRLRGFGVCRQLPHPECMVEECRRQLCAAYFGKRHRRRKCGRCHGNDNPLRSRRCLSHQLLYVGGALPGTELWRTQPQRGGSNRETVRVAGRCRSASRHYTGAMLAAAPESGGICPKYAETGDLRREDIGKVTHSND